MVIEIFVCYFLYRYEIFIDNKIKNCCDKIFIFVSLKRYKICVGFNSLVLYLLNDIFIFIGKFW